MPLPSPASGTNTYVDIRSHCPKGSEEIAAALQEASIQPGSTQALLIIYDPKRHSSPCDAKSCQRPFRYSSNADLVNFKHVVEAGGSVQLARAQTTRVLWENALTDAVRC